MKKIYKILAVILFMLSANKVLAAPANASFTDDEFYNCIVVKLNTDGFNSVYDRDATTYEVTKEELESITVLKCNSANIQNVKGLELLTNLTDLNLSDNSISSINLGANTKITNLLLSNNKLTTIDLSKNMALENLYLDGNKFTSLNLSNNKELLVLNINNNELSTLDLTNNTKIMDLKATNSAFIKQNKVIFKGESIDLAVDIKIPKDSENVQSWAAPSWITKDANIATVNQKGTVKAIKNGEVNIIASVEDIYSVTYNVKVSSIFSDVYNIDEKSSTIAVSDASVSTILNNIQVENGEIMIYNSNNKYVTSGNISSGFKLKILQGSAVLKTFTLTLVEEVANNDLESLEVKNYNIEFDKDKTNYTVIVDENVESVEVNAKAVSETATVLVEGNTELVSGTNTVTITVTGQDKTTKTYTINVIKKASEEEAKTSTSNVNLEKLEIKNYNIDFDKNVDSYNLKIKDDVTTLEITAEPVDNQATVKINGNSELKNKSKIEIVVQATDGNQKTYVINIEKEIQKDWKLLLTILELIALFLMILLCIVLIVKHKKKPKKEKVSKNESKNENKAVTIEENTIKVSGNQIVENSVKVSKKQVDEITKSETYLEKTIRFRRVCPKCGSINVLTNDKCYLCGKKLDEKDDE